MISLYNSSIISWSFYYLSNSFYHPLPWTQCTLLSNNITGEEREREGWQGQRGEGIGKSPGRKGRAEAGSS